MSYGITIHPLIPGRKEGSDRSEMVTQLLFGEVYKVLEEREKWIFIQNEFDHYECWIDRKQHAPITDSEYKSLQNTVAELSAEPLGVTDGKVKIRIPFGSRINFNSDFQFSELFKYTGQFADMKYESIERYASLFLEAPYLWGGKSVLGIDCSGFCQVVFATCGINLPRDAYQQANLGETVEFLEESEVGDLAYFDNKEGKITHVGIILNKGEIIHASGKVRIDRIDHQGIYNTEVGEYTHKLRIIKRINLL